MWSWPTVPAVRWRSWPRRPSRASGGCGANPSCCSRFYTRQGFPSECHIILRASVAVAVKQVRVSDLSGRQAGEGQFGKLIVHEHPQYQGPITLDVLPEEIGEVPEGEQYVSIEVIQPGERSGQRA